MLFIIIKLDLVNGQTLGPLHFLPGCPSRAVRGNFTTTSESHWKFVDWWDHNHIKIFFKTHWQHTHRSFFFPDLRDNIIVHIVFLCCFCPAMGGANSDLSHPPMPRNTGSDQINASGPEIFGSSIRLPRHSWHPWSVECPSRVVTFRAEFDPSLKCGA